jgi:ABC-2 type transport system ATP-binding protein
MACGGRPVLEKLSLSVALGSVTGLLVPSGSGKSTLMQAIVGVQRLAGGQVTVRGAAAGLPQLRRRVPLTHASQVLVRVADGGRYARRFGTDGEVTAGSIVVALGLGAATPRRRTA